MSEPTYMMIRREVCPICKGGRKETRRSLMLYDGDPIECGECDGEGYIETRVDATEWLLDVLRKLRWAGDGGMFAKVAGHRFQDLRIENDE